MSQNVMFLKCKITKHKNVTKKCVYDEKCHGMYNKMSRNVTFLQYTVNKTDAHSRVPPEWPNEWIHATRIGYLRIFLQNLKISQYCQKTCKYHILKLLVFLGSSIRSNFFNNDCVNILTRGNDSPDSVIIHTYLIY